MAMRANNGLSSRKGCLLCNDPVKTNLHRKRYSALVAWVIPILVCCSFLSIPGKAFADTGTVRVLIERADFNGCSDLTGPPDIYFVVWIDGTKQRTNPFESNIHPFDLDIEFLQAVDLSDGTIPIEIRQRDDDIGTDGTCNISPASTKSIHIELDVVDCTISGDLSGVCDATIVSTQGTFHFKISLDKSTSTADLNVRCIHVPVWPQPGEPVTIIATALDGEAQLFPDDETVDNIELWVDDVSAPFATSLTDDPGTASFSTVYTPAAGADQLAYRCRVNDDGVTISSNWRISQIGPPAIGGAVPVLYNGPAEHRIDVLFIPDKDSYTDGKDPDFIRDVAILIQEGFYAETPVYLARQNLLNFWIAMDTGDAGPTGGGPHVRPANWNKYYAFADAGVIIHTDEFRDFANRGARLLSVWINVLEGFTRGQILRHESGHVPFGLSDEYCCLERYYPSFPNPNVYLNKAACLSDPLAADAPDSCQRISDFMCQSGPKDDFVCNPDTSSMDVDRCGEQVLCSFEQADWFRVEPESTYGDDLMVNDKTPQSADKRRINWLFDQCIARKGDC
jgi:hypothetical protein